VNLPPLPLVDGAMLIDNSFIESLTTCPRKLEYNNLRKRIPSAERPALSFGTAIHLALEWRYKNCRNAQPTVMDEQDQAELLAAYFKDNPNPEDDHRQLNFAIDLVKHYNQRYAVEPFNLMTDKDGNVMLELSFAVPLFEFELEQRLGDAVLDSKFIPVIYTGRIDLPVLWDNQIIIIDHKTTSLLGDYYFDSQRISPQYEGYAWAFEQLTGKQVSGYCINAIRTKAQPAKPRTGWDAWWEECFGRHKEYLKPGQLDEWKTNTIALIKEFFYHYQQDYMPQKKKACTMYGKCAYYDICYLPKENREANLHSDMFQNNEWSPLKGKV